MLNNYEEWFAEFLLVCEIGGCSQLVRDNISMVGFKSFYVDGLTPAAAYQQWNGEYLKAIDRARDSAPVNVGGGTLCDAEDDHEPITHALRGENVTSRELDEMETRGQE